MHREEKKYLEGHTARDNVASQKVLQKNGFEFWKEVEEVVSLDSEERDIFLVWRKWRPGLEIETQHQDEGLDGQMPPKEAIASAQTI